MRSYTEEVIFSKYYMKQDTYEIVKIDEQFTKMLGYTEEDVKANHYTLFDLIPQEDLRDYCECLQKQWVVNHKAYLWHRQLCKDGRTLYVFCFGEEFKDAETGETMISCLITDTTSIRNMRQEMNKKDIILEELLDNMSGGVGILQIREIEGRKEIRCNYGSRNILEEYCFGELSDNYTLLEDFKERYLDKRDIENLDLEKCYYEPVEYVGEVRFRRRNGDYTWTNVRISHFEQDEESSYYMLLILDISKRKETELEIKMQNELLKLSIEEGKERFFDYNVIQDEYILRRMKDGELQTVRQIKDYQRECRENNWIHPGDKKKALAVFERVCHKPETFTLEMRALNKNGGYEWVRCYGTSIENEDGRIQRVVGKSRVINDEVMKNQELRQKAEIDELTGIYNNRAFMKYVTVNLSRDLTGNCAFIILDIDDFKVVNEAFGHTEGDAVLAGVGKVLKEFVKENGIAGRIGGDEFTLFISRVESQTELEKKIAELHRMIKAVSDKMSLSASIGVSVKSRVGVDIQELYKEADRAVYSAKRSGGNRSVFYEKKEEIKEEGKQTAESYIEEADMFLDEISDMVYITDIHNYELLYMNDPIYEDIRKRVGEFEWKGEKCYKILYNKDEPCEFCNCHKLQKNESLYWQRKNELNHCHYICKDTLINWEGRKARMEIAFDVSNPLNTMQALEKCYESNDTLRQCVNQMSKNNTFEHSYRSILRFIAKYYGAERSCLFEIHDEGTIDLHEWRSELTDKEEWRYESEYLKISYDDLMSCCNEQGRIIIDNVVQYKEKSPQLYHNMIRDKVWTVYGIRLESNQTPMGCVIVVNPKQHIGEILLLSTLSAFLVNEISRRKLWERQEYELTHDPQTGTYNRSSYMNTLAGLSNVTAIGLAVVDINNLKLVNNDNGLEYGNQVVAEIAEILKDVFTAENVYRFNSDDFTILCLDESRDDFAKKVEVAKERLSNHKIGACIGYVWDDFEMDIRSMTEHAEELLRLEKQKFHESDKDSPKYRQKEIIKELKNCIEKGIFHVYLQPKICMKDRSYCGAEALIRAIDPEKGVISPAKFIPVLEKTGTIQCIDFFVFEEVCKLIKRWQNDGIPLVPISFNFSRLTLLEPNLIQNVVEMVNKYDVPKSALEIEITETIGDLEYDMIARISNGLRNEGFKLSMDDFGTKYSSISTLSIMKFDILKIDRSMVNNLEESEISRKVMNHIIAMCRDLGIECIAEGVETEEQAVLLQNMDCMIAQGYLYGKPMPMEEYSQKYIESLQ